MKKVRKYLAEAVVFVIAAITIYSILNGSLDTFINVKMGAVKQSFFSDSDNAVGDETEQVYPPGEAIQNYKKAFSWSLMPIEDTYDPEHKSMIYLAYGLSKDEEAHHTHMYQEQERYQQSHPLDTRHRGENKYSTDNLVAVGQVFMREFVCMEGCVESIEILDHLEELDENYLSPSMRGEHQRDYFDNGGNMLQNIKIYNASDNTLSDSQKLKFVKAVVTMEAKSNWVTDEWVAPVLTFFVRDDDILSRDMEICPFRFKKDNKELPFSDDMPIYIDLGYYQYDTYDSEQMMSYLRYPMRLGEKVTFSVIYACPECFLQNAYLEFNDVNHASENDYNEREYIFVKITDEEEE